MFPFIAPHLASKRNQFPSKYTAFQQCLNLSPVQASPGRNVFPLAHPVIILQCSPTKLEIASWVQNICMSWDTKIILKLKAVYFVQLMVVNSKAVRLSHYSAVLFLTCSCFVFIFKTSHFWGFVSILFHRRNITFRTAFKINCLQLHKYISFKCSVREIFLL